MVTIIRAAAIFAAFVGWSAAANAGSTTYTLNRADLTGVADSGGTTQQEGGTFKNAGGTALGYYNMTRRDTTSGSGNLNVGSETLTLFFSPKSGVPPTIVVEGAHDFSSGALSGSVSAASPIYSWVRGASARYSSPSSGVDKLVLTWTGSRTLP